MPLQENQPAILSVAGRALSEAGLLGQDPVFVRVLSELETAASSDSSVIIEGETGSGKELFARFLHRRSARADGPLAAIHCGSFSDTLFQSELFGYERGAFTGADGERSGRVEQAHKGTLFLDDVCDLSPVMQLAMLRILQEGTFQRVGGTTYRSVDIRVVCATNRPLDEVVAEGTFRSDLFFRLNVIPIRVPALRERRSDVLLLAKHFLALHGRRLGKNIQGFSPQACRALLAYPWPGNVRELVNVVERAAVFCSTDLIQPEDLPDIIRAEDEGVDPFRNATWQEIQVENLRRVLEKNHGNRHATARELEIDRGTLYGMIKRWKLELAGRSRVAHSR
jgi:transcriptional regulator with PAS, ATPase and Fis domain